MQQEVKETNEEIIEEPQDGEVVELDSEESS